jgi:Ca2+-binding RTX toxin-like protein
MMMRAIVRSALVVVGLTLATIPMSGNAGTATTCFRSGATLNVDIALGTARVTIVRSGNNIQVVDRGTIVPCTGGVSTVTNTDTVDVDDNSSGGSPHVAVSLAGGPFAPGATTAGEGASPEIEFDINLGTGSLSDLFAVRGSAGADDIRLGLFGAGGNFVNLNGDGDADDITVGNEDKAVVTGGGGGDLLSGTGGPAFDGPYIGPLTLNGGNGNDVLEAGEDRAIIRGQAGRDLMVGGPDLDTLRGGPGPDDADGRERRDLLSGQDGDDDLRGSTGPDRLAGGPGDDALRGGPGRDACAGGPGEDIESSCEV